MKFAPNFCLFSKNKISPDYLVKFCFITSLLEKLTSLLLCLSTASTMPMADIKTSKDVPPADTKHCINYSFQNLCQDKYEYHQCCKC